MNRALARLLIVAQIFSLFFLVFMPTLIKILPDMAGKILYLFLVVAAVGFSLALLHWLDRTEGG